MLCIIDISGVTTITIEEPVCLVFKTRGRIPTHRLFPYPVGSIMKPWQSFPLINYVNTALAVH